MKHWPASKGLLALCLIVCSTNAFPQKAFAPRETTEIDRAFDRLYNYDFAGAQKLISQYEAKHPDDPLAPSVRAAGLLFQELGRLRILEAEFFNDDNKVGGKKQLAADPAIKVRFEQALASAKEKAEKRYAQNPNDPETLFLLSFNAGLRSDYLCLIEKKYLSGFGLIKESSRWATRCLKVDPSYGDAYLTTGMTEYIVSSVHPLFRWAIRFDEVKGNKAKAIENLNKTVRLGRFLAPFARIILSLAYLREKKAAVSVDLLAELSRDYPENQLIKTELEKIRAEIQAGRLR
jgi:hypothetical protein